MNFSYCKKIAITTSIVFCVAMTCNFILLGVENPAISEVMTPQQQVAQQVAQAFRKDSPNFPITRMSIVRNYALLSWTTRNKEGGGSAVLMRKNNVWEILLNGGGVVDINAMTRIGIPHEISVQLLNEVFPGWNKH
jgi:hypothetical protein